MGWTTRLWQADEDVIASAQQSMQGVSDEDAADALASALAWESAQKGGGQ